MIENVRRAWQDLPPWKLAVLGCALPWWLILAPTLTRCLWPVLLGSPVPEDLAQAVSLSYPLLLVGAVATLRDLSEKKPARARILATYFWLGLLSAGLVAALGVRLVGAS